MINAGAIMACSLIQVRDTSVIPHTCCKHFSHVWVDAVAVYSAWVDAVDASDAAAVFIACVMRCGCHVLYAVAVDAVAVCIACVMRCGCQPGEPLGERLEHTMGCWSQLCGSKVG